MVVVNEGIYSYFSGTGTVLWNSVQSQIVSLLMLFIENLVIPHDIAGGGGNLCIW